MFDYNSLINSPDSVYIKVPARSRKQEFVMYRINDDVDNELANVQQTFNSRYLSLTKNGIGIIIIPFENALTSHQLDNVEFEFLDDNFERFIYGHSYRDRSANVVGFDLNNSNYHLVDALQYVQDQKMYFNSDKIQTALKIYVKSEEYRRIANNDVKLRSFLHALANDIYKQLYTQTDLNIILSILKPTISTVKKEYKMAYHEIETNAELRSKTAPFGQYLKMYHANDTAKNITQQMLSMLASDFEPNPKLDLSIAGDLISQIYPPALISLDGKDKDNVVIFNPITGVWIHDENILYSLLTAIRPYSKPIDLNTMLSTFGAQARNKNSFIEPYHQSRYMLFKNLVLDCKTRIEYSLNDDLVKSLNFIDRDQLNVNYDSEVTAAPEFPGELSHVNQSGNKTWDPYTFFMAYADNQPERYKFLMFCLSLGLFPGHNFGVHVNIRGEARWGKTIINEIFKEIYPGRLFTKPFSTLNNQFAFTSYKSDTSIIWIDECNSEAPPLNDEYGTQLYDGLANNQVSLQVKNGGDLKISNPPQMFIDGTSFVKAKDMSTGPAGRTLVFKLPMDDDSIHPLDDLIAQSYAQDINKMLHDESVIQFLVNTMIDAYTTCLDLDDLSQDRLWSLKLNLGGHSADNKLLPEFAQNWRREMSKSQGGDVEDWFEYDFMPFFSTDPDEPTKMHKALAYAFYLSDYKTKYSFQDPNNQYVLSERQFTNRFTKLLTEYGWSKAEVREPSGRIARQSNKYLSKLNFNEQGFKDEGNTIPHQFTAENIDSDNPMNSFPLGRNVTGWFKIIKVDTPDK